MQIVQFTLYSVGRLSPAEHYTMRLNIFLGPVNDNLHILQLSRLNSKFLAIHLLAKLQISSILSICEKERSVFLPAQQFLNVVCAM